MNPERMVAVPYILAVRRLRIHPSSFILHPSQGPNGMIVRMRNQTFEFAQAMTVRQLLEKIDMLPEAVVVVRDEEILTEDDVLRDPDVVEVVPVISGGARR